MAVEMIERFDPEMKEAPRTILLQPFAMLPFLYCWSHLFGSEISGILGTVFYSVGVQWLGPMVLSLMRVNYNTEPMGDSMFSLYKLVPLTGASVSIVFNSQLLAALGRYREGNTLGTGEPVVLDEADEMNAPADRFWILVHIVVFWLILILLIEWKVHSICCGSRMREVRSVDNAEFFGKQEPSSELNQEDDGESSEVAQIIGDAEQLELRFGQKNKPKRELAYKI